MLLLLRRDFIVTVPIETAWRHLACIEHWPTWAKHIKQIDLQPPGELGPTSTGVLYLTNGLKPTWAVTEFHPFRSWKWTSRFLWLTIHYDHIFEEVNPRQTKLTWTVEGSGFGVGVLGRLFAKIYRKDLDQAIPLLIEEMETNTAAHGGPS